MLSKKLSERQQSLLAKAKQMKTPLAGKHEPVEKIRNEGSHFYPSSTRDNIDNLIKGASGQAIQNMNLIYGFSQSLGLK